jgi:hypothetical protein
MTKNEINALSTQLQAGDRFYYTGDMANGASFGTITKRIEDPKWGLRYDAEFDDERFEGDDKTSHAIFPLSFAFGPGQRFKTIAQYESERREMLALYAR